MDLEQIVKETVAKMVDEKTLTAAEKKKKEELVMAMKKDFKGPEAAMYAIATDKAKKLAEGDVTKDQIQKKYNEMFGRNPNTKFADVAKALGVSEQEVMSVLFMGNPFGGMPFRENELNEDYEVAMAQDSLDSIIRAAMMLKAQMGDQEVNLPAWIQDHITNSENYIYQAAKGYHESSAQTDDEAGESEEMDEGYNFEQSAIESASGDKISHTEEDDYGRTIYWSAKNPNVNYFVGQGGEFEGKIYLYNGETGERYPIGDLKHYGDGQNHSADDDMHESQQELDEFVVRRWQHYAGIK